MVGIAILYAGVHANVQTFSGLIIDDVFAYRRGETLRMLLVSTLKETNEQ